MLQPTRLISTPFAQEGEKTEIQNVTGEFDNSATYRLGFPPLTMQSIRLGGKPPKGTDFNGVLFDITENISFLCKGGRYQYNAGLSTLIGGYPEGSNLLLDDNVTEVVSTVAGNQNNPNIDMTGWILKPNKTTAVNVADASGETQQQVNYNGGSKWHSRVGGYQENERVVLANGDIVKSTVDGNTNDPNVDMTGWVKVNSAGQIFDASGLSQQEINDYQESKNKRIVSVKDYGAIGDGTLHTLQEWVDSGKFSGLLAIQVAYPTAASLTDSIDRVAIQTCIDQNIKSLLDEGSFWIDSTIHFKDYGKTLEGYSVSSYGNGDHVRSKLLHKFNGDLVKINENLATSPRGRNKIENIGFVSDDLFIGKAIRVISSQNHLINLSFYKFKDGAIRIGGKSYGTYIEKPSCDQCGSNGSYDISSDVDTGGASANDYNTITVVIDGIFETPKTGAISLKESDPFYISRNYIEPFGSTSTSPMVEIKNSPSGNTKGWIYDNYLGSINSNDFAISAIGSDIHISKNIITDFAKGIYLSSQNGSAIGNDIKGYSSIGIQLASVNTNINNDLIVNSNTLLSKSTGAIHGIIASGGVNGNLISSNIVRGKHDYYIRLISAFNTVVEGNFLLPVVGAATSGAGIYEDDNCTGNNVRNNSVQATTKYRRYSFDYDEFYLSGTSTPTTGVWVKGSIVKVPDPVSFGAIGYICTTAGTGAAAVWQKYGLIIKQIPARQDVVASDLATMVAAHNALLADLRAANIMAT